MTKFGQKFCSKHPLKQEGDIVDIPQEQKDAAKLGASGNLGLIGGTASAAIKTLFKNPISTIKQIFNKPSASATTGTGGGFKPIVTGNKVYDTKSINKAFESRFGPSPQPKNNIKRMAGGFFNAPKQYKRMALKPPNYKKHTP